MNTRKLIDTALSVNSEESSIEFKESFAPASAQDWCELIKDIVAIANTEGGIIVFGINDEGIPIEYNIKTILEIDPADITNKIYKYTGFQFSQFKILECIKDGKTLVAILIEALLLPLVFEKPGTYDIGDGKQRNAFSAGTIYFRHGAKSEPGNTFDLASSFDRRLNHVKEEWFKNMRQVVEAPIGSTVVTINPSSDPMVLPMRLTDDPNAPLIGTVIPDKTHPYRQKELMDALNNKLPQDVRINQYDIISIRKIHDIDTKRNFYYHSKFGTPQYSPEFLNWILQQYEHDNDFFTKTRQKNHERRNK